jgi:hypothetical protein
MRRRHKKNKPVVEKRKPSAEEEVYLWNQDNPADKEGTPYVYNPEDTLTNIGDSDMNVPITEYKNRGKFFPKEHSRDKGEED